MRSSSIDQISNVSGSKANIGNLNGLVAIAALAAGLVGLSSEAFARGSVSGGGDRGPFEVACSFMNANGSSYTFEIPALEDVGSPGVALPATLELRGPLNSTTEGIQSEIRFKVERIITDDGGRLYRELDASTLEPIDGVRVETEAGSRRSLEELSTAEKQNRLTQTIGSLAFPNEPIYMRAWLTSPKHGLQRVLGLCISDN